MCVKDHMSPRSNYVRVGSYVPPIIDVCVGPYVPMIIGLMGVIRQLF
jgi:hypothetical protein